MAIIGLVWYESLPYMQNWLQVATHTSIQEFPQDVPL